MGLPVCARVFVSVIWMSVGAFVSLGVWSDPGLVGRVSGGVVLSGTATESWKGRSDTF